MSPVLHFLIEDGRGLWQSLVALAFCGLFFAGLARLAKPATWIADGKAALPETRINAVLSVLDQLSVTPAVALFIGWTGVQLRSHGLQLEAPALWASIGPVPTQFATVFVGDF
ncbi:MAG: Fatty acid hydroxylase, partial [Phenylobacterium sp.]|nr:Fatty acid hydroxylase [Phenylobacterium sp.]